jgi:predicted NBD/HSP70 family sugar kinase
VTGSTSYSMDRQIDGSNGGTTQAESRKYNERLIISLIRRKGQLSKVELTRLTGLSAQTVTTLVNRAADAGLLHRLTPLRGKIGQPTVPFALNPAGACSLGLRIDRKNADLTLVDFVGNVLAFQSLTYDYPTPSAIIDFVKAGTTTFIDAGHHPTQPIGLGIASPFKLWEWADEIGAPRGALSAWKQTDIRVELERIYPWPVYLFNDAMVAAAGELSFGLGKGRGEFIYAYIGFFIGGGLVLDHHLFPGRNRQAGDLGSIPIPCSGSKDGETKLLLETASLYSLSRKVGPDLSAQLWRSPDSWTGIDLSVDEWVEETATSLALAIRSSVAIVDVDSVVIDGAIPGTIRERITREVRRRLAKSLSERPEAFTVMEGSLGRRAPAVGAASIPFMVRYSNEKDILFKDQDQILSWSLPAAQMSPDAA